MPLEKEEIYKIYTITAAALKTFIGASAPETISEVKLGERLEVITTQGSNPHTVRTYYITLPEARTALALTNGEVFHNVDFGTNLIITTIKRNI